MPTVFKKLEDGKLVEMSREEAMRRARPPLLSDSTSIEIVRKYTEAAKHRYDSILTKEKDPIKRATIEGMISALMIMKVELCGFE
jgi:hypothetical protein